MISVDLKLTLEIPARGRPVPKEDTMRFRSCATFVFSLIFFSLPEVYAADANEGRNLFIKRCLGCHAFSCNKEGPRLGGLFGRKVATVEDYKFYSQELRNSAIVWTDQTLDSFFKDAVMNDANA